MARRRERATSSRARLAATAAVALAVLLPPPALAQDPGPLRFTPVVRTGVLQGEFAVHGRAFVWQTYDASRRRYRLNRRAGGRTRRIAVSTRPFGGFDIGPGPRGGQTIVFSRCLARRGCDLRQWRPGGRSRSVPGAAKREVSEGLPAIWGDRVAFINDLRADVGADDPPGHYRSRGRRLEVRRLDGRGGPRVYRLPARCGAGGRSLGPEGVQLNRRRLLYGVFCDEPSGARTLLFVRGLSGPPAPVDLGLSLVSGFDFGPGGRPFGNGYFSDTGTRISGLSVEVGGTRHDDPEVSPAIEQVRVDGATLFASRCAPAELVTQQCSIERAAGARAIAP